MSILACLAFVLFEPFAKGDNSTDLLAIARARQHAACAAIRTLSTDVDINIIFPEKKLWISGKYWRSFDTVRIEEYPPGTNNIENHLLKNGELRGVGKHRLSNGHFDRCGASRVSGAQMPAMCDVWGEMMLHFYDSTFTRYDYSRFLNLSKRTPKAAREKLDGFDCVRVTMSFSAENGDFTYTFWHDIARNYLIRKMAMSYVTGKYATNTESEIHEFRELAPGVFVPVNRRLRVFEVDKLTQEIVTTLSNVKVNTIIADETLTLPFVPSGTVLHDRIDGTRYPIDANWKPIGPRVSDPIVQRVSKASEPGTEYRAQSEEEPGSRLWWLVPVSAAVLSAAVIIGFYRRRQSRREQLDDS
jgi:hypothetical protein